MTYPVEIRDKIIEQLIDGSKSLRQICKQKGMPDRVTVLRWMNEDEDFAAKYARARAAQADGIGDEMAAIEDAVRSGKMQAKAARVVLWSMQWRAARIAPKKYGQKLELEGSLGLAHLVAQAAAPQAKDEPSSG